MTPRYPGKITHVFSVVSVVNLLLFGLVACGGSNRNRGTARAQAAPIHVDSVVPRAVALARFREGLINPGRLDGGAKRRGGLVRRFVDALERGDTMALVEMAITRAEFAYLYYPAAPEASPPYDLDPGLSWFMLRQNSRKGLLRALEERGARSLGYLGHRCDGSPSRHGDNAVWGPCVVRRLQATGDTVEERLFGPILERDGVFKFLSYANNR